MFRIFKIASILTQTSSHSQQLYILQQTESLAGIQRFYSNKNKKDKKGKCPTCGKSHAPKCNQKTRKDDCKPVYPIPCTPPPCPSYPKYRECDLPEGDGKGK